MSRRKPISWEGKSTKGVDRAFLSKITAAAVSQGATRISVFSGRRDPKTNTGVPNSNHLYGHALDAKAYVPGRGWILLGTLIAPVASDYGLRSGDQPGFYKGARDPEHVDDGYNINGRKPLPANYTGAAVLPADNTPTYSIPGAASDGAAQAEAPSISPPSPNEDVELPGTQNYVLQDWASLAADPLSSPETRRLAGLIGG